MSAPATSATAAEDQAPNVPDPLQFLKGHANKISESMGESDPANTTPMEELAEQVANLTLPEE